MKTIESQLRAYARYADETLPWVDPIDLVGFEKVRAIPLAPGPMRKHPRPWAAVGAAAVVLIAVGWITALSYRSPTQVPLGAMPDDPAVPTVSTTLPLAGAAALPASIEDPGIRLLSIAESPLPNGASIAFNSDRVGESSLVVVDGGEMREVARVRGAAGPLSPGGRLLAYTAVPLGQPDVLSVVDLTTGRLILDEQVLIGDDELAQTNDLQWSADGRRLAQLVRDTATHERAEVRVWEVGTTAMALIAVLDELPGNFIAMSPDGMTIAAESGPFVAVSPIDREAWTRLDVSARPPEIPDRAVDDFESSDTLVEYRWSDDGGTLAGLLHRRDGRVDLATANLQTGEWSSWPVPDPSPHALLGWSGDDLLIARVPTMGAVEVATLSANGNVNVWTTLEGIQLGSVAQHQLPPSLLP